jgi:hypothetical protein
MRKWLAVQRPIRRRCAWAWKPWYAKRPTNAFGLSAVRSLAQATCPGVVKNHLRQAAGDDSGIDYSDIPPLTDKQLAQFRRTPKVLVAARIDREVYG